MKPLLLVRVMTPEGDWEQREQSEYAERLVTDTVLVNAEDVAAVAQQCDKWWAQYADGPARCTVAVRGLGTFIALGDFHQVSGKVLAALTGEADVR